MPTFREFDFGSETYQESLRLRKEILRDPLGLAWEAEAFEGEENSMHLGAFEAGQLVACMILKPVTPTTVRMRQVAVASAFQRRGIGGELLAFAERQAAALGVEWITAHARAAVVPFYERHGYTVDGPSFFEISLLHYPIVKRLS